MKISNCSITDIDSIMGLYDAARQLQTERKTVVWPFFNKSFLANEIEEKRQWKIIMVKEIVCNWVITYEDKDIWKSRENGDAIYIHRIATNPAFRGNRSIEKIVQWAIEYAKSLNRQYVRLDTLGNNTKLIQHYTSAGFDF